MLSNADNCKVMYVRYDNKKAEYDMNDVKLECVSDEKDLGVIISEDLKWEKQCSEAVRKANRMMGMIKRNFVDRSKEMITPLYKSLLIPRFEYCSQLVKYGHKSRKEMKTGTAQHQEMEKELRRQRRRIS